MPPHPAAASAAAPRSVGGARRARTAGWAPELCDQPRPGTRRSALARLSGEQSWVPGDAAAPPRQPARTRRGRRCPGRLLMPCPHGGAPNRDKELAKFEAFLNKEECMHINALVRGRSRMAYPIKR